MRSLWRYWLGIAVLLILSVSKQSYAKEIDGSSLDRLQLRIPLFDYDEYHIDGNTLFCLDELNLRQAFKVHATYQDLTDISLFQDEQILKLNRKYASCAFELKACKTVLYDVDLDRNNLYELYEDTIHINEMEIKKQRIKFVLIGVGGGVAALAIGFLVGYFIGK